MKKFFAKNGDVYILVRGKEEWELYKTPIGEPIGLSPADAGQLQRCEISGVFEEGVFLAENGKLKSVLVSEERLEKDRRRLEDRLRRDRRLLFACLELAGI